jgi:AraC-like DNA-binding protein
METRLEKIPVLSASSYGKVYFKHAPELSLFTPPQYHFEIFHRCMVKDAIAPHRLDFYGVMLVTKGGGVYSLGTHEYYVQENSLCFISPQMISAWQAEMQVDNMGYLCMFSESFFSVSHNQSVFLQELPFFQLDGSPVIHLDTAQAEQFQSIFKLLASEFKNANDYSHPVYRGLLQALLNKALSWYTTSECIQTPVAHHSMRLVKAFRALYMQDFERIGKGQGLQLRKISEYAEELGVSQNHLNDTIKDVTGHSAGQLIKQQLANQATMCLMHADKSISEIAYALGFEDPSYFARFYKNQTGQSPTEYRQVVHP